MKKILIFGLIFILCVMSAGCGKQVKTDVGNSPELEYAHKVIKRLYGENNTYAFLSYENDLISTVQDGDTLYRDLTFFEVYSNNKKICWFSCNAHTLKTLVKEVSDSRGYRQVRLTEDGAYLDKYEIE